MKRLYFTVEGQTEKKFVDEVLVPHLADFDVMVFSPRLTGPRARSTRHIPRGGMMNSFAPILRDIRNWLARDANSDARFTMMVDYYDLPHDFPRYTESKKKPSPLESISFLEQSLATELGDSRFVPYLQLHEFESLVLCDPARIRNLYPTTDAQLRDLIETCATFPTPEDINGGQHSHPKYRIKKVFSDYHELTAGHTLAAEIGLATLRERCPHFGAWLTRLEGLDRTSPTP
jgi:hypothetical protein